MRLIDRKKFNITMTVITALMLFSFGFSYMNGRPLESNSVAPGRLGAPSFSHYIYGDFGENALHKPMFATFGNGRVYVSDTNNHRVQVFAEDGAPLFKFGDRGDKDGQFFYPYGIVVGPDSNVYVADMYRHVIQIFTTDGEYIRNFGADDEAKKYVNSPGMIYLDDKGRLFVPNIETADVAVFDLETETLLQTIGVYGDLFAPNAVTVDGDGYIYVVDTGGQRIIVYSPDGSRAVRLINGSEDGRGQASLANPRGIAVRGDWIFVASNLTHQIFAYGKDGKEVFNFGKQGEGQNEFMHPNGMMVDSRGRMLITDTVGGRVAVYR